MMRWRKKIKERKAKKKKKEDEKKKVFKLNEANLARRLVYLF